MPRTPPESSVDKPNPVWYQIYFAAVLERNRTRALIRIERARSAIEARLLELRSRSATSPREIQDLKSAMIYLRLLFDTWGGKARACYGTKHGTKQRYTAMRF